MGRRRRGGKRTGQAGLADFSPPPIEIVALLADPVTGLLENRVGLEERERGRDAHVK